MSGQLDNYKPTANASLNWIKGNHTVKFGGEMIVESHASRGRTFVNTYYYFNTIETADPSIFCQARLSRQARVSVLTMPASWQAGSIICKRIRKAGDTWATCPGFLCAGHLEDYAKITLDYGLRYDFQTYLREQYGAGAASAMTSQILRPMDCSAG